MQVNQYTFQSPSSSQVQIGRPDTSVSQEKKNSTVPNTNETQVKAQSFAANQTQEVKPTVNTNKLLDVYA